jgi:hypothetical protein
LAHDPRPYLRQNTFERPSLLSVLTQKSGNGIRNPLPVQTGC